MLLRRLGNKAKIAGEIQKYFPAHELYIEPFFGAGGMFFNKPLAKYNYVNDIDNDVFNLFQQVMYNKDALYEYIECIPYHKSAWDWLKKLQPENDLQRAARFCELSNYSVFGASNTMVFNFTFNKLHLLNNIEKTFNFICRSKNIMFHCADFRKFLQDFSFTHKEQDEKRCLVYCDPPYLGTYNNYSDGFKPSDFTDLLDVLSTRKWKYAISEFKNDFVISEALKRGLFVHEVGERQSMKNRNTEILILNYKVQLTLF